MVFEGRICWYLKKDLFVFDEGFVGPWWRISWYLKEGWLLCPIRWHLLDKQSISWHQCSKQLLLTAKYLASSKKCPRNAKPDILRCFHVGWKSLFKDQICSGHILTLVLFAVRNSSSEALLAKRNEG